MHLVSSHRVCTKSQPTAHCTKPHPANADTLRKSPMVGNMTRVCALLSSRFSLWGKGHSYNLNGFYTESSQILQGVITPKYNYVCWSSSIHILHIYMIYNFTSQNRLQISCFHRFRWSSCPWFTSSYHPHRIKINHIRRRYPPEKPNGWKYEERKRASLLSSRFSFIHTKYHIIHTEYSKSSQSS